MKIPNKYTVKPIDPFQCKEWLMYKHYAKRIPSIEYSFGLFQGLLLVGVCTFGTPPRVMNDGESIFKTYRVKTLELNRLCVNDGLEKNALSYFVANSLNFIETPSCIVSYADYSFGHNGYIYQATNWIYTGLNQVHEREWFFDGKEIHQRTLSSMGLTSAELKLQAGMYKGEYTSKHRYFKFLGTKRDKKIMQKELVYPVSDYPKGNNKKYDSSYKPTVQLPLF